jgi:hypothetical protein
LRFANAHAASPSVANVATLPLYRLFAHSTGIHFYTIDETRKVVAMANGWTLEGVAAYVSDQPALGTVPLYVLVVPLSFADSAGDPMVGHTFTYTTNEQEKNNLLASPPVANRAGGTNNRWRLDGNGIAGYVAPTKLSGTVPLYKLYHPERLEEYNSKQKNCLFGSYDNLYTTSQKEMSEAISQHGYQFIGIAGYVWPQATSTSSTPPISVGSAPAVNPDTDLLKRGCTRPGVGSYKCPTIAGYEACERYRKNGKVTACTTSANEKVQAAMEKLLFSVGCSRFLGRPDEFLCKTQKGKDLCETYRKNGTANECWPKTK